MSVRDLKSMNAFERLREASLTDYEALVYLRLVLEGPSSAKEISEASGVPHTRVYDVLEALELKGWVEIGQGRPMRFKAKPPSEVINVIRTEYQHRLNRIEDLFLNDLQSIYDARSAEGSEIWFVKSVPGITNKIKTLASSFKKELCLVIGNLDMVIYSGLVETLSNLDQKRSVKILASQEVFDAIRPLSSQNVMIRVGRGVIPFNVILSDKGEVVFHLMVGIDQPEEKRKNLAVYISDKSLARVIYEYIDLLWKFGQ
ncbi:MAG: TrmB family transcriptional regulator [Candidatus Methanomethylicaceae archaeon]